LAIAGDLREGESEGRGEKERKGDEEAERRSGELEVGGQGGER
jgi:hypothetical protein